MSQQINLLLPEFRPRFDWLALPVVAGIAGGLLAAVIGLGLIDKLGADALRARDTELSQALQSLQLQVQGLGQSIAGRKENPALALEVEAARLGVDQRREVIKVVTQGQGSDAPSYSGLMDGFGRQLKDGVWLTGFAFQGEAIEMRGRLTDSSLLPAYIAKLNAEPAFAGRKFAALDMKAVDPAQDKTVTAPSAGDAKPRAGTLRFVEFALVAERIAAKGAAE